MVSRCCLWSAIALLCSRIISSSQEYRSSRSCLFLLPSCWRHLFVFTRSSLTRDSTSLPPLCRSSYLMDVYACLLRPVRISAALICHLLGLLSFYGAPDAVVFINWTSLFVRRQFYLYRTVHGWRRENLVSVLCM